MIVDNCNNLLLIPIIFKRKTRNETS